jgi:cobalt-zinc-cadmium efflux system membrane fusion protein
MGAMGGQHRTDDGKTAMNTSLHPSIPRVLPVVMLTIVVLAGLVACERKADVALDDAPKITGEIITFTATSPALKNIVTARVAAPYDSQLSLPGRLVWDEDRTVRVFTPFAGRVSRVIANVGDRVTVGQVLAEMQSPDFAVAQADAHKAVANLAVSKAALARVKELAANGVAAGKDLVQAEGDFANAEAEANRAEARLKLYGSARNIDQRFALVSPIAGTVVERNLNPGQELRPDQPGAPQFVVTDPSKLWVQLDAAEANLGFLKSGTPILVSSNQYPDDTFAGELRQISDYIDPLTRTLKLRATVNNADRRLKAEMFVNARLQMPKSALPTVPEKAIFLDGIRRFVFVKSGPQQFTRRSVKIGAEADGMVPVSAGLNEGEEVAVTGNLFLQQMIAAARVNQEALDLVVPPSRAVSSAPAAIVPVPAGKAADKPAAKAATTTP